MFANRMRIEPEVERQEPDTVEEEGSHNGSNGPDASQQQSKSDSAKGPNGTSKLTRQSSYMNRASRFIFNPFRRHASSNAEPTNTFKSDLNIATISKLKMVASAARRATMRRQTITKGVLLPDNVFRVFWDFANVIMLAYTVFEIPYTMVFLTDGGNCEWTAHEIVNLAIDIFFLVDICLAFNTAFIDEFGALVTDHKTIGYTYLRGWFFPDLISSVPLGSVMCAIGVGEGQSKLFRFLKAFRLLKLARLFKILRLLKKWDTLAGSSSITNLLNLFKFVSVMIFVAHLFGCIWYVLLQAVTCRISLEDYEAQDSISMKCGCQGDSDECIDWNWLNRYDPELYQNPNRPEAKYLASIYFTVVTLSTVGYGDITPVNDIERLYAVFLALGGALVFAFCIGSISSLASQGNITDQLITEAMHGITDFLRYKNIPRHLQAKVRSNVFHATRKAPHLVHQCLQILPRVIKNEILIYLTADEIEGVPFFQNLDIDCRARISALLRPCTFKPREYIYHALDAGTEMYFIVKGEVEILNIEEGKVVGKCKAGEMLGEACMFSELIPFRYHSVRARSQVELLELQREDMHAIVKPLYPDVYQTIKDTAMEKISLENADRLLAKMGERAASRCATLERDGANYRDTQRKLKRAKGTMLSATLFLGGRAKTKDSIQVPPTPPALMQSLGASILTPARPRQLPGTGGYASGGGATILPRAPSGDVDKPDATSPKLRRPSSSDSRAPSKYQQERDHQQLQHNMAVQEQLQSILKGLETVQLNVEKSRLDTETRIVEMERKMDDCLAMVDQLHTWRDHDVNLQMYRHVGVPGWEQPWHFQAGVQIPVGSRRSSLKSLGGGSAGDLSELPAASAGDLSQLNRDVLSGNRQQLREINSSSSRKHVTVAVPEPPAESDEETPVDGPLTSEQKKSKHLPEQYQKEAARQNASAESGAIEGGLNAAPYHFSSNASSLREELIADSGHPPPETAGDNESSQPLTDHGQTEENNMLNSKKNQLLAPRYLKPLPLSKKKEKPSKEKVESNESGDATSSEFKDDVPSGSLSAFPTSNFIHAPNLLEGSPRFRGTP